MMHGVERRKYPRLSIALPVTYWKVHDGSVHQSMAFDITKQGFSLKPLHDLIIEDILHFEMKIVQDSVIGTAKVLWSRRVAEGPITERAGCIILNLDEDSQEIFYDYIDGIKNRFVPDQC
jgi:hypothetical protein